ncbi:MAG TPA: hypothetical protein VHV31_12565 [Nitrolancea sp.]|nr:hypothetical protein [Nitrolancea sp.]
MSEATGESGDDDVVGPVLREVDEYERVHRLRQIGHSATIVAIDEPIPRSETARG